MLIVVYCSQATTLFFNESLYVFGLTQEGLCSKQETKPKYDWTETAGQTNSTMEMFLNCVHPTWSHFKADNRGLGSKT